VPGRRDAIYRVAAARGISMLGSQLAVIALVFEVYRTTESAVWVSVVVLSAALAMALMAPVGGWLGDTFDRRTVMITSDLAAAAVFILLVFAGNLWLLIGLSLVATIARAPFFPAAQAALPNLAAAGDLAWANGLVTQASSLGTTIGPLVGGVLVAAVGTGAAFGVNAVTFLISAGLIISVRKRFQAPAPASLAVPAVPFSEGLRVVFGTRRLRLLTIAELVGLSVIGWAIVADAPLAALLHVGAVGFAALVSSWGAGMVIGAWATGRWLGEHPLEVQLVFAGMLVAGAMVALIGLLPAFSLMLAVSVIGGAAGGAVNVARSLIVQRSVPDGIRSRVFAVVEVVASASFILGLACAGPAIALLGVRTAYVVAGLGFALSALVLLPLLLPLHTRREQPART